MSHVTSNDGTRICYDRQGGAPVILVGGAFQYRAVVHYARRETIAGQQHDVAPDLLVPVLTKFYGA
jgi:hypothetical protein